MTTIRQPSPRGSGNFELYAWFFMRVSGTVLLFIAVFHLLYMHLYARVESIDYAWVIERWSNPAWRLYDWLLLTFALSHGTNGVRTVLDDYISRGMRNVAAKWVLYVLALIFFVMGTQVIVTAPQPPA